MFKQFFSFFIFVVLLIPGFVFSQSNLQEIKDNCFKMINDYYNPKVQVKLINRAIKKILDEK